MGMVDIRVCVIQNQNLYKHNSVNSNNKSEVNMYFILTFEAATAMALTQTAFGLGYMLGKIKNCEYFYFKSKIHFKPLKFRYSQIIIVYSGPAVGAYLYDVGGFSLPFLICGSTDAILSALLLLTIQTGNKGASPRASARGIDNHEDGLKPNDSGISLECLESKEKGNLGYDENSSLLDDVIDSNGATTKVVSCLIPYDRFRFCPYLAPLADCLIDVGKR